MNISSRFTIASFAIAFLTITTAFAQSGSVSINTTGNTPDASAILDVSSTNQGVLVPRMTQAQRTAISSPATGLMVYQTDGMAGFYFNSGTASSPNWTSLNGGSGTVTNVSSANTDISVATRTTTPTLTLNSGTGANQIVKLDGSGKLPAVDGSQLTNLPSGGGSGTVTNVSSANTDISVATGTTTPTLTLNSGTGANQIVKLDGSGKLPAVDGSALTGVTSSAGTGNNAPTIGIPYTISSRVNNTLNGNATAFFNPISNFSSTGTTSTPALTHLITAPAAASAKAWISITSTATIDVTVALYTVTLVGSTITLGPTIGSCSINGTSGNCTITSNPVSANTLLTMGYTNNTGSNLVSNVFTITTAFSCQP